jgi:hypothetical protein
MDKAQARRLSVVSQLVKPAPSLGIARCVDHPEQRLADRGHPGKSKDAAFKPAYPRCSGISSIDQRGGMLM